MKYKYLTIALLCFIAHQSYAQYILKDEADVKWYENISQEDVVISNNADVLFSGEDLYYSIFCFNATTKRYTKNSKVAYVELVGDDGMVFRHKIRLEDGKGQGDFFIPSGINTGHYKLIGYTRWMLNANNHFFQKDLVIINPFKNIEFKGDVAANSEWKVNTANTNDLVSLELNKTQFKPRESVQIQLKNINGNAQGQYAISVRKLDEISALSMADQNFNQSKLADIRIEKKRPNESIFLPEIQGEMLTGRVIEKATQRPAVNLEVALSILSDEALQDIVVTNEHGIFYFQIKQPYSNSRALVQVLSDDRDKYRISVNAHQSINYDQLEFSQLILPGNLKSIIEKRSVFNQIEAAYSEARKNQIRLPEYPEPFFGNYNSTFKLDDYKRFPTVAETLIEVVEHAWHERRNGEKRFVNVRERENDPYYLVDILPMVVVDGALIQDHESLLYFDAAKVESINVYRDEYYYQDRVYQGILKVNTFDRSFYEKLSGDHLEFIDLLSPELQVDYNQPVYTDEQDMSRLPDYRTQLYWQPNVLLSHTDEVINFYTSDVSGTFLITLQGFTIYGRPLTISQIITVE